MDGPARNTRTILPMVGVNYSYLFCYIDLVTFHDFNKYMFGTKTNFIKGICVIV